MHDKHLARLRVGLVAGLGAAAMTMASTGAFADEVPGQGDLDTQIIGGAPATDDQ